MNKKPNVAGGEFVPDELLCPVWIINIDPIRPSRDDAIMYKDIHVLFQNVSWWSAFLGWLVAQSTKLILNLCKTKRVDFQYLVSLGGMPSAHSAMVSALATSIGLNVGFDSHLFVLALALAFVVMFDASTVRRAAGQQARLLNEMVAELFKSHHFSQRKLKELLGHTRKEVIVGMVIGVISGVLMNLCWDTAGFPRQ